MHPFLPYEIADVHAQRLREEMARDRRSGARRRSRFGRSGRRSRVEEAVVDVVGSDDFVDVELGGEVDVRQEPLGEESPAPGLASPSPCGTTGSSG